MKKNYYITTTLPYVNADPHIGFAMEIVRVDAIARFKRLLGYQVIFNTGTDEHGQKIYQKAVAEKKDPQKYCDEYAAKFINLKSALNLSYSNFVRTTNEHHIKASQEFWKRCFNKGDIYKAKYKIKYCVGCELEKSESELHENKCPLHPNLDLQIIEEENYFFRFSKYQKPLLDFFENNPAFVLPKFRFEEVKNFVKKGLKDFSVSRLKNKMPWGIAVPGDTDQVMYVWFDALINYISTLGWPEDEKKFTEFWPGVQVAGKDNLRQQSTMWQAMLMSAGLPNSKQIYIEGFVTFSGQKMSKSLGNVVDPFKLVDIYGTEAVRFYLLKEISNFEDGDYSDQRMIEIYNSELANELGNLVSRVTNIAEKDNLIIEDQKINYQTLYQPFEKMIDNFQFNQIFEQIFNQIKKLNKDLNDYAPWKKTTTERKEFITQMLFKINQIGHLLLPYLPITAEKIILSTVNKIRKPTPLFPRINHS